MLSDEKLSNERLREPNGPRKFVTERDTCTGCPALLLEDWSFEEENDGVDSGTDAYCTACDPRRNIATYWRENMASPEWCPASALARRTQPSAGEPEYPTIAEAHQEARKCILYGIERATRDWRDQKAQDAAKQMAEELLQAFDHYLPADVFATPPDQSRVERLEAALRPFAEIAERIAAEHPGWYHDKFQLLVAGEQVVTLAPFIAARQALGDRS